MKLKSAKKSQITMIMIIGLAMFMLVGLVLYFSKSTIKKQAQIPAKEAQDTAIANQPIKDFVTKCVDKLAKDAIVLLGRQGGYIYTSQGGTLIDFSDTDEGIFFIKENKLNVAYNIKQPLLYMPQHYASYAPEYPWPRFPYPPNGPNTQKNFHGIFGVSTMPPLRHENGQHSIQAQIEKYVDNNMETCLDFTLFKKQGYDISVGKIKTKATIGSNDITVKSEIPLTALNTATKETLSMKEFSTTINIRLQEIYNFLSNLVQSDITDITFNMKSTNNNRNGFFVHVKEDAYENDDMISVSDENSIVYGQLFEYVFARENRRPALYLIEANELALPSNYLITQDDLLQGSELKAEDPDEDNIAITVKALLPNPDLPVRLDRPQIKFKIEATDGSLSDYQIITVNRND